MSDLYHLVDVLTEVLNDPVRASALKPLANVKYPYREIHPEQLPSGTIKVSLKKRGFEYKHRGKHSRNVCPVNLTGVVNAFRQALTPDYYALGVVDTLDSVILYVKECKNDGN